MPKQKLRKPGIEAEIDPRPNFQASRYKAAGKLVGKAALVTGGDSVAVLFSREGADVAITALPTEKVDADETRRAIESTGQTCVVIEADLSAADDCQAVIARTVGGLGQLDILVSNAAHQNRKLRSRNWTTRSGIVRG